MAEARLHPSLAALAEVSLMFSPALPAYLWLWPNVKGTEWLIPVQVIVYLYFLAGTLFIGLRRWNINQLGLNRQGVGLGLTFGALFLTACGLGVIATDLAIHPKPFSLPRLAGVFAFYLGLVGTIEELLFRGLIYRALLNWRGTKLAIWGSSLAFGLYHIGQHGLLGVLGISIIGLIFGVIRWRTGGIIGLIFTHGLLDILATEFLSEVTIEQVKQFHVTRPAIGILSDVILFALLIYLWKLHPRFVQKWGRISSLDPEE